MVMLDGFMSAVFALFECYFCISSLNFLTRGAFRCDEQKFIRLVCGGLHDSRQNWPGASIGCRVLRKPIPVWIHAGGVVLAMIAGCVNAVGLIGLHRQALSHVSGLVSLFAAEAGLAQVGDALHALAVLFAYFFGAAASGALLRRSFLQLGRRYGAVLGLEALLLAGAAVVLSSGGRGGDCLAAMACGLQNAMATSYSGAVVRTTHMTGIVTDLGLACGHLMRGQPVDGVRLKLYGSLLVGFLLGSFAGAVGFARLGFAVLLLPALVAGAAGACHATIRHLRRRSASAPARVAPASVA
jgi:uncharacterized membrane protein YoaK (UPF0700 family)